MVIGLAAGLFKQAHAGELHRLVDGFEHVDDGEAGDGDGGEGFHFDAGLCVDGGGGEDADAGGREEFKIDGNLIEGERVAEGDEFAGAFRGLNTGDSGDGKDFAFGAGVGDESVIRFGCHLNEAFRDRAAKRGRFATDIHHVGGAGVGEVG